MVDHICKFCGKQYQAKTRRSSYCGRPCKAKHYVQLTGIPCARCGEPVPRAKNSLPEGQAMHQACKKATIIHGTRSMGYRKGCRCDDCTAANTAESREWYKKPESKARKKKYTQAYLAREEVREYRRAFYRDWYYRPDVQEQQKAYRKSPEVNARRRETTRLWEQANDDRLRAKRHRRRTNLQQHAIPYTGEQLANRMAMFGWKCWICGVELDGGFHMDHVKPVSKGGWDTLSNLRPACSTCNLSKGATWPFASPRGCGFPSRTAPRS